MEALLGIEKLAGVASSAALLDFLALNFLGVMGVLLIIWIIPNFRYCALFLFMMNSNRTNVNA